MAVVVGPLDRRILTILSDYLSPINARAVLNAARRRARSDGGADDPAALVTAIKRGVRLHLRGGDYERLGVALSRLEGGAGEPPSVVEIRVDQEGDVATARLRARDLCRQMGARSLATQKVATAVSELARNIVMYTPGGRLCMTPRPGRPARIVILAEDRGDGIADLDLVLSGEYRSRTGLGKGLSGVKRLMQRFEIDTGPTGTRIEVEAVLA